MNSTKKNWIASISKQLREDLMKINIDAFRRHTHRYLLRDNHVKSIMSIGKQIEDYPILMAECLIVCKTIIMII